MKEIIINDVLVLSELPNYIIGSEKEKALIERLKQLVHEGRDVIIDMSAVRFISADGLIMFVIANRDVRRHGHRFALCRICKHIDMLLVITKQALVFDVYQDVEHALDSFTRNEG